MALIVGETSLVGESITGRFLGRHGDLNGVNSGIAGIGLLQDDLSRTGLIRG